MRHEDSRDLSVLREVLLQDLRGVIAKLADATGDEDVPRILVL
jgi:hypothetical protein